jgi:hypothetical protein
MMNFQNEMNKTVVGFVAQISALAHRAALDTVESAFSDNSPRKAPVARSGQTSATAAAILPRAGRPRGGKGVKRTPAELVELSEKVVSFIKANPGLRIEQINKEIGTTTKDLALPLRKLVSEGYLTAKGQKRSTTYSAGRKTWKS